MNTRARPWATLFMLKPGNRCGEQCGGGANSKRCACRGNDPRTQNVGVIPHPRVADT